MKAGRCICKALAAIAAMAAAAYLVVTYWETLVDLFYAVVGKIKEKKAQYCCCAAPSEYDDYADHEI